MSDKTSPAKVRDTSYSGHHLWVALILVTGVTVALALLRQGLPVLYPFIQDYFGLSRAQVGLITSAQTGGFTAAVMLAGVFTDKYGVRRMILASLFILIAFTLAFPLVNSFYSLIVLAALIGITASPLHPTATRVIIDWFPGRVRASAMSVKQMGVPIGGALTAAVLPSLAIVAGWRMAAMATGALVLTIAIAFILLYRNADGATHETHKFNAANIKIILHDRGLMTTMVWGGIFTGFLGIVSSYLMLFVIEELEFSPVKAGGLLAIAQTGSIFARVLWGVASDFIFRRRRIVVLAITGFLTVLWMTGVSIIGAGIPASLIYLIAVIIGISTLSFHGVFIAAVGEQAEKGQVGVTAGLASMIDNASQTLMPPFFGLMVDITDSYRMVWAGSAAAALVSTLVLLAFVREPHNR